ncbi:MAG: hypothetical protein JWQ38_2729 [Flavipsychrobacter sp.]|nr:hypothetical protein [Flavipsychrobacter sp.]
MRFGLFGDEFHCYFEDGTRVSYQYLWEEIGKICKLDAGHGKKLSDVYPHLFIGAVQDDFSPFYFYKNDKIRKVSFFHRIADFLNVSGFICNLFYSPLIRLYDYIENNDVEEIEDVNKPPKLRDKRGSIYLYSMRGNTEHLYSPKITLQKLN